MKQQIRIIFLIVLAIIYSGCFQPPIQNNSIKDLTILEQKPYIYTKNIKPFTPEITKKLIEDFAKKYFYPWNIAQFTFTYKQATWGHIYAQKKVYSENLTKISQKWFDDIIFQSNFEAFDSVRRKAITVENSQLKVFPTIGKIFYDPKKAGEGFPFDYNINTSIKINTPLFISHFSKNKLWAYVESSIAAGWISIKDIAFVDQSFISLFENGLYFINGDDNAKIYKNGYLLNTVKLGTLFPKAKKGFIVASKNYKNEAFIRVIDDNESFHALGIEFTHENIRKISQELSGERYGWGGFLNNRDCSLMIKDFYAPFGIFLQRNSAAQKNDGKMFSLKDFTPEMKKEFILKNAIPFKTLIYLPGHIMIYVGEKNKEPLVFHNMWGLKTIENDGEYGRKIIGKAVVTTLYPGQEIKNHFEKDSILTKIESLTILGQE